MRFETSLSTPDVAKRHQYESSNPFPLVQRGDITTSRYQRRRSSTVDGTYETTFVDIGEGRERLFAVGQHNAEAAAKAARAPVNESRTSGGLRETNPVIRRVPVGRGLIEPRQLQVISDLVRGVVVGDGLTLRTAADAQMFLSRIMFALQIDEGDTDVADRVGLWRG